MGMFLVTGGVFAGDRVAGGLARRIAQGVLVATDPVYGGLRAVTVATAAHRCSHSPAFPPNPAGNFFIDENVLRDAGMNDFSGYAVTPGTVLMTELFLKDEPRGGGDT